MEQERIRRETEEKEWLELAKKIKEQFKDTQSQWEKDKNDVENLAMKAKEQAALSSTTALEAKSEVPTGHTDTKMVPKSE
jgi:mannan polymerase II complex ANP1 subunit